MSARFLAFFLPTAVSAMCTNACVRKPDWASDGYCDDGGPGSEHSDCQLGTDCADCGTRGASPSPSPPPPLSTSTGILPSPSPPPPGNCAPGCPPSYLADNYCNNACNTAACNYDNGDCTRPSPSPPASACDSKPIASTCCHDGPGSSDYVCSAGESCGKGECLGAGLTLCIDGSSDYVCPPARSCGRGVCVPAGKKLCGSVGTKVCPAGTFCCGPSAAAKDDGPFECRSASNPCPLEQISMVTYTSMPYMYDPDVRFPAQDQDDNPSDHVCDVLNPLLPEICECKETTGGSGANVECKKSIANIGDIGVRLDIEPCKDPAYIQTSYNFLDDEWTIAGKVEANGDPILFPIPGASLMTAGLFISVKVEGNAESLDVDVHLSVCVDSVCDGDILVVGSVATGLGFPLELLDFDDIKLADCPRPQEESNMIIIAAAVAGGFAVILAIVVVVVVVKKKKALAPKLLHRGQSGNASGVVLTHQVSSNSIVSCDDKISI